MESEFDVSICCATFNQVNYIRETLDSIISQECNGLKFEIIIHDDCSTDGTIEVLKEYEVQYENVKVIYEETNQFSKGKKLIPLLASQANGKYFAFCEGDDTWNDKRKILKQYSIMEDNESYSLCVCKYNIIDRNGNTIKVDDTFSKSQIIPFQDFVLRDANFVATCSVFCRTIDVKQLPQAYLECKVGDFPMQLFLAEKGICYFLNEACCSYRVHSIGSLTDKNVGSKKRMLELKANLISTCELFDGFYNYKYTSLFAKRIRIEEMDICIINREFRKIKTEFTDIYMELAIFHKIKIIIKCYFPFLERIYKKCKIK